MKLAVITRYIQALTGRSVVIPVIIPTTRVVVLEQCIMEPDTRNVVIPVIIRRLNPVARGRSSTAKLNVLINSLFLKSRSGRIGNYADAI